MKGPTQWIAAVALALSMGAATGCGGNNTTVEAQAKPEPLSIETAQVEQRPIDRYLRVTGSLMSSGPPRRRRSG